MVYITYHVDVGETPFLIALDYEQRSVVICIRGTLSLKVIEAVYNSSYTVMALFGNVLAIFSSPTKNLQLSN